MSPGRRRSAVQMISSQSAGISAAAGDGSRDVSPSAPLPVQAPACASSRSTDCRNRA
uniref:Uncharacterized protein n=1 Tax=Papilio xuthus TaxID=66420 RepID=I4DQQ0_PAPXU|nr:unknown secreted protein [Papilio xuthus]